MAKVIRHFFDDYSWRMVLIDTICCLNCPTRQLAKMLKPAHSSNESSLVYILKKQFWHSDFYCSYSDVKNVKSLLLWIAHQSKDKNIKNKWYLTRNKSFEIIIDGWNEIINKTIHSQNSRVIILSNMKWNIN